VGKPGSIRLLREQEIAGSSPAIPILGRGAGKSSKYRCGRTERRRPVKATIGGSTPPAGARIQRINILGKYSLRKGKPIGDGTRLEIGRAMSLGGSTPSPSAPNGVFTRDWSSGTTPGFQPGDRGSNPRSRSDVEIAVCIWDLAAPTERSVPGRAVRHGLPKSDRRVRLPRDALGNRLTGRLPDFESGGGGSNPPSRIDDSGAVAAGSDAALRNVAIHLASSTTRERL
jgi:hypothetical protein